MSCIWWSKIEAGNTRMDAAIGESNFPLGFGWRSASSFQLCQSAFVPACVRTAPVVWLRPSQSSTKSQVFKCHNLWKAFAS